MEEDEETVVKEKGEESRWTDRSGPKKDKELVGSV